MNALDEYCRLLATDLDDGDTLAALDHWWYKMTDDEQKRARAWVAERNNEAQQKTPAE